MDAFWTTEVYGNAVWRWATALGLAVLCILVGAVLRGVSIRRLRRFTEATPTVWDDALADALAATRGYFLAPVMLALCARVLELPAWGMRLTEVVITVGLLAAFGTWIDTALRSALRRWAARDALPTGRATLVTAVRFLLRLVIWSIVLLVLLSNLGVEVGALVAGLGVGGIAAALAVQSTLGDTIAAFSLYADRPFDIGDMIRVGDDMGSVIAIGWRSTRIRALGGQLIVLPNSDLAGSRVHNFGRLVERRVVTEVGVVYDTPAELVGRAAEMLREAVEELDGVRFDRSHFHRFGPSSLDFELVWFVESGGLRPVHGQAAGAAARHPGALPRGRTRVRVPDPHRAPRGAGRGRSAGAGRRARALTGQGDR